MHAHTHSPTQRIIIVTKIYVEMSFMYAILMPDFSHFSLSSSHFHVPVHVHVSTQRLHTRDAQHVHTPQTPHLVWSSKCARSIEGTNRRAGEVVIAGPLRQHLPPLFLPSPAPGRRGRGTLACRTQGKEAIVLLSKSLQTTRYAAALKCQ